MRLNRRGLYDKPIIKLWVFIMLLVLVFGLGRVIGALVVGW